MHTNNSINTSEEKETESAVENKAPLASNETIAAYNENITITVCKSQDPVSKLFRRDINGNTTKTPAPPKNPIQFFSKKSINSMQQLDTTISIISSHMYLIYGSGDDGKSTRAKHKFPFSDQPSICCIDFDAEDDAKGKKPEQLANAIRKIIPDLNQIAHLAKYSSSANIFFGKDRVYHSGNCRLYIAVADGRLIPKLIDRINQHSWLYDEGYIKLSEAGTFLERGLADAAMKSSNQPDYAGKALCKDGLEQKQLPSIINEGRLLTKADIPADVLEKTSPLIEKAKVEKREEATKLRQAYEAKQFALGINKETVALALDYAILPKDYTIKLDNETEITVEEILADKKKYHKTKCYDLFGGNRSDRTIIYSHQDHPYIHSFQHGDQSFKLVNENISEGEHIEEWLTKQGIYEQPIIYIKAGDLHNAVNQACIALASQDPPKVFQFGDSLVRIAKFLPDIKTTRKVNQIKKPAIVNIKRNDLINRLSSAATFKKYDKNGDSFIIDPCNKVSAALLEAKGDWGPIKQLEGISECPILRDDGQIYFKSGYDSASKLYIEGNIPNLSVPEAPTLDDAKAALKCLLSPFGEFPLIKELDRSVLFAYLITLALRQQINLAPLFCISSTTPGTGKGLIVECCNLIIRGRDADTMAAIKGNNAEDETRKRFTAMLIQGNTSVNLDNWTSDIGGEAINTLLTSSIWSDRLLGASETVSVPNRITLAATGNNLRVKGDMVRRSLILRLDADIERPENRSFKIKNLPKHILENRDQLLSALFTILKGYQLAGQPGVERQHLGRFEVWSAAVCGPIRWLGLPDPTESQKILADRDPEEDQLGLLLTYWYKVHIDQWFFAKDVCAANTQPKPIGAEELHDAIMEIAGKQDEINTKIFGMYLSRNVNRICGDLKLVEKQRQDGCKKPKKYRVERIQ